MLEKCTEILFFFFSNHLKCKKETQFTNVQFIMRKNTHTPTKYYLTRETKNCCIEVTETQ